MNFQIKLYTQQILSEFMHFFEMAMVELHIVDVFIIHRRGVFDQKGKFLWKKNQVEKKCWKIFIKKKVFQRLISNGANPHKNNMAIISAI